MNNEQFEALKAWILTVSIYSISKTDKAYSDIVAAEHKARDLLLDRKEPAADPAKPKHGDRYVSTTLLASGYAAAMLVYVVEATHEYWDIDKLSTERYDDRQLAAAEARSWAAAEGLEYRA